MERGTDTGKWSQTFTSTTLPCLCCTTDGTNVCYWCPLVALRHPRRAPLRQAPVAPLLLHVRARHWRTSRCWMRCVWTVVTWWRTASCDTCPACRAEAPRKRGLRTQDTRLVNEPNTLLSTLKPFHSSSSTTHSEDRTKPLHCLDESVVAVRYALNFSLDTAPCWAGGVSER